MENEYHAGHVGLLGQINRGRWGVEMLAKFAFGNMHETALVQGSRVSASAAPPAAPFTAARGVLAQDVTNGGIHVQDEFSFMQDVGFKLYYCPAPQLKLSFGYSLLYWSRLLRPGDQIDLRVDQNLLTNNAPTGNEIFPAFQFNSKDFYVHGLNVGLEYQF